MRVRTDPDRKRCPESKTIGKAMSIDPKPVVSAHSFGFLKPSRYVRAIGIALVCCLAVGGIYLGWLQISGNFNTVVDGEFYRSGQLSETQVAEYAAQYGIKTIINLRGDNTGSSWYDAEVAVAKRLGIRYVNFGMSARRELTTQQALTLISLMREAQKPLLIHCKAGADRSGLASALYMAAVKNAGEEQAESQLSIRYGHFSLPFIPEYAMDRTFEALEPLFGFTN